MVIRNVDYKLDLYYISKLTGRYRKSLGVYPLHSISIIDINYLKQLYGIGFVNTVIDMIADSSIFDLKKKQVGKILDYLKDLDKGYKKIKLNIFIDIDYIYKRGKLISLIEKRKLKCLQYYSSKHIIKEGEEDKNLERALFHFTDIYGKSFDKKILQILTCPEKLKEFYECLSNYTKHHPHPDFIGLILTSLLSRRENKNYLRI